MFLLFVCFVTVNVKAQKLPLNQVVNAAYGSKIVLGTDSLLYVLSDCSPFIEIKPQEKNEIKIVAFKNNEQLTTSLTDRDTYLLRVGISDVALGKMTITFRVYKINRNIFNDKDNFLIFHDERTIECVLTGKKQWNYSQTITVKKHLTD